MRRGKVASGWFQSSALAGRGSMGGAREVSFRVFARPRPTQNQQVSRLCSPRIVGAETCTRRGLPHNRDMGFSKGFGYPHPPRGPVLRQVGGNHGEPLPLSVLQWPVRAVDFNLEFEIASLSAIVHGVLPLLLERKTPPLLLLRPMSCWRTAWRNLTRAIQCPACGQLQQPADVCRNGECKADIRGARSPLHGLRFHDLRHHAITELSEGQASDQIIMSIAGHVSLKMLAHYSHVRMAAKRKALDALSGGGSGGSYGTNNATNSLSEATPSSQVIEKTGGADGIRIRQQYENKGDLMRLRRTTTNENKVQLAASRRRVSPWYKHR